MSEAEVAATVDALKIIDWDEALNQVCGDEEFLDEVLTDLLEEAQTAKDDIGASIENKDFESTFKAAHRIKGSASYLYCDKMRQLSLDMQLAGQEGSNLVTSSDGADTTEAQADIWTKLKVLYAAYVKSFVELEETVADRRGKSKNGSTKNTP